MRMDFSEHAFDRTSTFNWWVCRFSNEDLAASAGLSTRNLRLLLDRYFMQSRISGNGRGRAATRRFSTAGRNAVGIVAAMNRAGMTIDFALAIFEALPNLADLPTDVVDFCPTMLDVPEADYGRVRLLVDVDPDGGWLTTDQVPGHIVDRHCRPIARVDGPPSSSTDDVLWFPTWAEQDMGGLPPGFVALGEPIYQPEVDPLGFYALGNNLTDENEALDHSLAVIDGRWLFLEAPEVPPRDYLMDVLHAAEGRSSRRYRKQDTRRTHELVAKITPEGAVSTACNDTDRAKAGRAYLQQRTTFRVNLTTVVRMMKRVALKRISPEEA